MSVASELTLDAALRDAQSGSAAHRERALQSVASAVLAELGERGPSWHAARRHARGDEVLAALRRTMRDEPRAELRGAAFAALGRLGEPDDWDAAVTTFAGELDEASSYERECALIYVSFLGVAAREAGETTVCDRSRDTLTSALTHALADVRFQAAMGVAEIGGLGVESALLGALDRETEGRVRTQIVEALALDDPASEAVVARMSTLVEDKEDDQLPETRHAAAMLLAAARHPQAVPQLVSSLRYVDVRDDAIEALAVFSREQAAAAIEPIRRLTTGWLTPGATRVRAAYALSRWSEPDGPRWLGRLRFHPRSGVRAAVRDAWALLSVDAAT